MKSGLSKNAKQNLYAWRGELDSFALFYLFYCLLDLRKQQRDYEEFKDKMDEEMERILKEPDEKFHEEEDQE